jgi:hypothetical protein
MDVVQAAYRTRHASHDRIESWRIGRALAFLMPTVQLSYRSFAAREEQGLILDALDELMLTNVQVSPVDEEFRIFASWDLYPLLFASPDFASAFGSGAMAKEVRRVLDDRQEIQETVVPLYRRWVESRVKEDLYQQPDVREALKAQIEQALLEADLHALTSGAFVAPASTQRSTSRSTQGESP